MKSRGGFSLFEMVVVVGITLTLSIVTLTYNRAGERQLAIFKDQALVVGLLDRAKSLAIQKYQNPALAADYAFCAFGLHFGPPRDIVLFADLGSGSCNPPNADYRYNPAADPPEILERQSLDPRDQFMGLPEEGVDILFIPPDLTVTSSIDLPVDLKITSRAGGLSSVTTVSPVGQIITQ